MKIIQAMDIMNHSLVVLKSMSVQMVIFLTTVEPMLIVTTLLDHSHAPVIQVKQTALENLVNLWLKGFTAWAPNSGCRDINECCFGSHSTCSHTCSRTSAFDGICFNNAGSYR